MNKAFLEGLWFGLNPMNSLRVLRDLWRGYSHADVLSLRAKIAAETRPGAIVPITSREAKAIRDLHREDTP